jgi:hypothetical protein
MEFDERLAHTSFPCRRVQNRTHEIKGVSRANELDYDQRSHGCPIIESVIQRPSTEHRERL